MARCLLFSVCGGCKYDFCASDYCEKKLAEISHMTFTDEPYWAPAGARRRADFCFADGVLGFFERGTKNIVTVDKCPNLVPEINAILPRLSKLPWNGAGTALVTSCENGIDIAVNSNLPFFTKEFKDVVQKLDVLRVTWNGTVVVMREQPIIKFGDRAVEYPSGAFLQPTVPSENAMRDFVVSAADGAKRVLDLFCGIGNFTFALGADGFDIAGCGVKRDLMKRPLLPKNLNNYDCVVMDPPRAGAFAQCKELVKSSVPKVIYVSCNPMTFRRDADVLVKGGYKIIKSKPFDQFVGSEHWEIGAVMVK